MRPTNRAWLLVACIAAGAAVGWLVEQFAASAYGWLAIPAFVATAWLFVADPSACARCKADEQRASVPSRDA